MINQLELLGCFGMSLSLSQDFQTLSITAFKGKTGPCYETGRTAVYKGAAAAAFDDDAHLIYGKMRVCEKTGLLYSLPVYHDLIQVSEGNSEKLSQLDSSPILFDCDTYEADLSRLVESLHSTSTGLSLDTAVLYPGPFRLLILGDGTIIRRGLVTLISSKQAKILQQKDRVQIMPSSFVTEAISPYFLPDFIKSKGSGCLFFDLEDNKISSNTNTKFISKASIKKSDFSVLDSISSKMKSRLLNMIDKNAPYFILTGSDPMNQAGCCPNNQVGEANLLVQNSILNCYSPPAPPDSCSSGIYAFVDEIDNNSPPGFRQNKEFREKVYLHLVDK